MKHSNQEVPSKLPRVATEPIQVSTQLLVEDSISNPKTKLKQRIEKSN